MNLSSRSSSNCWVWLWSDANLLYCHLVNEELYWQGGFRLADNDDNCNSEAKFHSLMYRALNLNSLLKAKTIGPQILQAEKAKFLKNMLKRMPTAPRVPKRSPIQVLTGLDAAWLQWSDENWYIQRDMAVGKGSGEKLDLWTNKV